MDCQPYDIVNTMMKNNDFSKSSSTPTEIPPEPWGYVAVTYGSPTDKPPEPW
jgi:hypothetical protein